MMKRAVLIILFAFVATVSVSSVAQAVCYVNEFGILYLDTDCDKVIDYDDMTDADFDTIPDGDPVDNCPTVRNGDCDVDPFDCDIDENGTVTDLEVAGSHQSDWDGNDIGNACDDYDFDGVVDYLDNCKSVYNPGQEPEYCTDTDGDRFEDLIDNCPTDYNTNQLDSDGDGIGDWCDNCRTVYNPAQNDLDCPSDDDGSNGGPPQFSTNPPAPEDGLNYDYGTGRIKGNGVGNSCSLAQVTPGALSAISLAMMLAALVIARRRR